MLSNFFSKIVWFYDIMSKNMVEPEGPQTTLQYARIRVECWISKATCTHLHAKAHVPGRARARRHARAHTQICKIYCFSKAKIIRGRASVLRCTYIACLGFS